MACSKDCLGIVWIKKIWTIKGLFRASFMASLRGRLACFMG